MQVIIDSYKDSKEKALSVIDALYGTSTAPAVESTLGKTAAAPLAQTPHVTAADRDTKGLPWDARIHSSTKGKNQDGSWKKRKNLPSEEYYNNIVAELLSLPTGTGPTPAAPAPMPTPTPAQDLTQQFQPQGAPSLFSPGAPPANFPSSVPQSNQVVVAAPPVNDQQAAFRDAMQWIAARKHSPENPAGRITDDMLAYICNNYQIGSIANLAHSPHLIPHIQGWLAIQIGEAQQQG